MDVAIWEDRVAARTIAAESQAERRRNRSRAAQQLKGRKLLAQALPATRGADDDTHWIELPNADIEVSFLRYMAPWLGLLGALAFHIPMWSAIGPWTLLVLGAIGVACAWDTARMLRNRPARIVVSPRGYFAVLDGRAMRMSGRIADLRFRVGGYIESSPAQGLTWVEVHGPDGRICEAGHLRPEAGAAVKAFAQTVGARA